MPEHGEKIVGMKYEVTVEGEKKVFGFKMCSVAGNDRLADELDVEYVKEEPRTTMETL